VGGIQRETFRFAWGIAAAAYGGTVFLHLVITTHPGVSHSVSTFLRLPGIFRASSVRSTPTCWIYGGISVPPLPWLQQAIVWTILTGVKWCFEFFLVCPKLASQV
jgi:hypothetical protein